MRFLNLFKKNRKKTKDIGSAKNESGPTEIKKTILMNKQNFIPFRNRLEQEFFNYEIFDLTVGSRSESIRFYIKTIIEDVTLLQIKARVLSDTETSIELTKETDTQEAINLMLLVQECINDFTIEESSIDSIEEMTSTSNIDGSLRRNITIDGLKDMNEFEKSNFISAFLSVIEARFPIETFGYQSFDDLGYDEEVLSSLFTHLKENEKIINSGYMEFKLGKIETD